MHFSCVRKGRGCLATEAREKRNSTIGLTRSILRSELSHLNLVALRKSTFIWNCDAEVLMGYVIPINSVTVITHLAFWNRPFPYILCKCRFNPCQNKRLLFDEPLCRATNVLEAERSSQLETAFERTRRIF